MKKIFGLLLLTASVSYAKITPQLYAYGEKPRLAKPEAKFSADLAMARGEYETFTIALPQVKSKDLIIKIKLNWKGKAPAIEFKTYQLFGHNFKSSSFKTGFKAGEVVDIPVPYEWLLEGSFTPQPYSVMSQAQYLFEIFAKEDATAGAYEGDLSFSASGETITLPIKLQIYDVTLPSKFALKTTFGYANWGVTRRHFGDWHKDERIVNEDYMSLALEHRIDLHKINDNFPAPGAKDPLTEAPNNQRNFMMHTKPLFAGAGSKKGFQLSVIDLPVKEEYKTIDNQYPLTVVDVEKFWKSLNSSVVKHNLKNKSYVYYIDEPTEEKLKTLGNELRQIKKWAPDVKFLVTTPWKQNLDNAVDIWVINLIFWDRADQKPPSFYKGLQAKGQELWFYVGCNSHGCSEPDDIMNPDLVTDRPSAYARSFPWYAVRYQATGILYYDTVYTYDRGPESPWVDNFDFTGYGEGGLFYPCTPRLGKCTNQKMIPALRLKILRDGLEDAEILRIAKEKGFDMLAVNKLIRNGRDFAVNTADYEMVKRQALAFIAKPDAKKK